MMPKYDAVVVGSGPNGLAAAITVAQRGGSVLILEGSNEVGGGMRSQELTLPGFTHDVCSSVYPLAISSPYFKNLPLEKFGLKWIHSPSALAHPMDDGSAILLDSSVEQTASGLGEDEGSYLRLMRPLVDQADLLFEEILRPVFHLPKHPFLLARFGLDAIQSAEHFAIRNFKGAKARALFAGIAGHSMIPLSWSISAASALVLTIAAHLRGWPIAKGGAMNLTQALVGYYKSLGGEIQTGVSVRSLKDLPERKWTFLDITPKQFLSIGADQLRESEKVKLNQFKYGCGIFKMDFALSGPIPWIATDCAKATTVHLGGSLEEIIASEQTMSQGQHSAHPYVLLVQPSLFDSSRTPDPHQHTVWAYCHVPQGSNQDMSRELENQIERYAPGFKSRIIEKSSRTAQQWERYNPNYVGGDISGGLVDLRQTLFRPRAFNPYRTPIPGVYLCSSSTPPGPGVHGMCGHLAAMATLC